MTLIGTFDDDHIDGHSVTKTAMAMMMTMKVTMVVMMTMKVTMVMTSP